MKSRAQPREIITEVLKALQELNVFWKKIGHYNWKCRWFPDFLDSSGTSEIGFGTEADFSRENAALKFEVQVCNSWK